MRIPRFLNGRVAKEQPVLVSDPRVEGWESVSTFEDQKTAVAWRDHLRSVGVEACCVADHPLDRNGREGDRPRSMLQRRPIAGDHAKPPPSSGPRMC